MRGRKPKPTARQISEGDPRKKGVHKLQEKLASEPRATPGLPRCPRHLRGRARSAWTFWAVELTGMGQDKRPDAMMLEGACVHYARAVEADLLVQQQGMMVEEAYWNKKREERIVLKVRSHPAIMVSNAAWRQVRAFSSEFGLSPVSRTRLVIDKADTTEKDLAELLSQPRQPRTSIQ
jgi:P27 family predicted phage terminase small subunit